MRFTAIAEMPTSATQDHILLMHRSEARTALVQAANALAPLSASEPIDPARFAKRRDEPSPSAVQEVACTAITAEAVVALLSRVEALEAQVMGLRGSAA